MDFVGELEYITDMIELPGQLFACFVRAEATPLSTIATVDTSQALVRFFWYLDIKSLPLECDD